MLQATATFCRTHLLFIVMDGVAACPVVVTAAVLIAVLCARYIGEIGISREKVVKEVALILSRPPTTISRERDLYDAAVMMQQQHTTKVIDPHRSRSIYNIHLMITLSTEHKAVSHNHSTGYDAASFVLYTTQ